MDFVLYVVNTITTTDFDDYAEVEREVIVERDVYWHDGVKTDVRKSIKFDEVNSTLLPITGKFIYEKAQNVSVLNKVSNENNSFSNSCAFSDWLNLISMEEIPNYIFEVYYTSELGKTTIKYFVEKADFEEPTESKKAKLYRFEGFDRKTNKAIRKLTFSVVGCDRGLTRVLRVFGDFRNNLSIKDCIIKLNGIDISDYFNNNSDMCVIPRKNIAEEYDGSRFRVEYTGVQHRIIQLEEACKIQEQRCKDKPDESRENLVWLNEKIEHYRKMLASKQRIHGGF